jgi:hypothetical protein
MPLRGDRMEFPDPHPRQQMAIEIVAKAPRVRGGNADILVHVKDGDEAPVENDAGSRGINERGDEIILRRRAPEDDARLAAPRYDAMQPGRGGPGGRLTRCAAIGMNLDR